MKKIFLVVILFLCFITNAFANRTKTDSLKAALLNVKQDTQKVNLLINLGAELQDINPDTALLLGKEALTLSRKITWIKGIASSLSALGVFYEIKGNIKTGEIYEDSALSFSNKYNYTGSLSKIYNELGNVKSDQSEYSVGLDYYFKALHYDSAMGRKMIAGICNNIGLDYEEMGNYVKAEEYYFKTQKIFEQENNQEHLSVTYSNFGNLYYEQGNYEKGLENNFKALKIDSSRNKYGSLVSDYQNIGLGYSFLGNYSGSIEYTFRGLALGEKIGELEYIQKAFGNIGQTFLEYYQQDSTSKKELVYIKDGHQVHIKYDALPDSALVYEQNAMKYCHMMNDKIGQLTVMRSLGDLLLIKKLYPQANAYYLQAYNLADSLGVLQQEMELSQVIGHTYVKMGDYKTAIKYLDGVIVLKDTLFGKEKTKQFEELEAKYQNEKKQKEIEALAQKNQIQNLQIQQSRYFIFGFASLALLIAIIAFLLIRQNRINAANTRIELGQKLLRSQMNPHFIFNAMTSVQNYIYKEEPEMAANYLSSVFRLMRSIIESSKEEYILLEKEIETLKHYLILQQLCFHNKFDFKIDVGEGVNIENTTIPPMMAQPFIENAIVHGIVNKVDEKGLITLRLTLQNDMLLFEIEDNGVGREKAREIRSQRTGEHLSVAINITKERIALLNKKSKKKITMQIVDLKNAHDEGLGTKIIFCFPLNTLA